MRRPSAAGGGHARRVHEDTRRCAPRRSSGARPRAYIHPGHVFVSAKATAVSTVLGSCVAVCLWDPGAGVGGMSRYLLPEGGGGDSPAHFGDVALRQLIERLLATGTGTSRSRLLAKVFGGACVNARGARREGHLGLQNVQVAHRILAAEGIPVVAEDTGGTGGRHLVFHTDEGTAWVRPIEAAPG